jgi:hypothetical protein
MPPATWIADEMLTAAILQPKVATSQQLSVAAASGSMQRMVAAKELARESFASRLSQALDDLGVLLPAQKKAWLKREFDISLEAARKWLQGIALPEQARWESLARALDVRAEWLRDGVGPKTAGSLTLGEERPVYGQPSQPVKLETLTSALTIVSAELRERQRSLPPAKFAEAVTIAYECIDDGMPEARVLRYVRAAIN